MKSRTWGVKDAQVNFVDGFECHVRKRITGELSDSQFSSSSKGLACPTPVEYMKGANLPRTEDFWWPSVFSQEYKKASQLLKKFGIEDS